MRLLKGRRSDFLFIISYPVAFKSNQFLMKHGNASTIFSLGKIVFEMPYLTLYLLFI